MSVQARRARTEPSALMGQTNTPASAKKVGTHIYVLSHLIYVLVSSSNLVNLLCINVYC